MKPLLSITLLALLFTACGDNANNNETVADESNRDTVNYRAVIDETNKSFTEAALKGDTASFASNIYHPDAEIYPPNEEAMGAKSASSMMATFPKMGIKSFSLNTKELYEGDDVVTEVGTYEMGDGNKTIDKGKYIVVWKKDGDKWKLFRDIWNSDNPYSPPPPASKK